MPTKQVRKPLVFPIRGLHENAGYDVQPPATSSDMLNMRVHDALKDRGRGGKRGGSSLWYASQINGSADIQLMSKVVRPGSYPTPTDTFAVPMNTQGVGVVTLRLLDAAGVDVPGAGFITEKACFDVVRDSQGNYYLAGQRSTTWTGGSVGATVWKLDPNFTVLWTFETGTGASDGATSLALNDAETRVVVTGNRTTTWTGSAGAGASLWYLSTSNGAVDWTFDLGGNSLSGGTKVEIDSSGNVFVAGSRETTWTGSGTAAANVWKLSAAGSVSEFYDTGQAQIENLDLNSSGSVLVSSHEASTTWTGSGGVSKNIFLMNNALDNPTTTWLKHNAGATHYAFAHFAPDGNYYVSGTTISGVSARKFNAAGTDLWTFGIAAGTSVTARTVMKPFTATQVALCATNGSVPNNAEFYILNDSTGAIITSSQRTSWTVFHDFDVRASSAFGSFSTREASLLVVAGGTIKKVTNDTLSTPSGGTNALTAEPGRIQAAQAYGKVFFVDGGGAPKMYDLATDVVSAYTAIAGTAPTDCRLICRYRGRIVQAGDPDDPHNWFMSAVGDPRDYDYAPAATSYTQAVAGNNSEAGLVGDIITALIPFSDDFLIFGCDSSIWLMANDPAGGGSVDLISEDTGVAWGSSWAKDPDGNAYFMGTGGIYRITPGSKPVSLTDTCLAKRFGEIDMANVRALLAWDTVRRGLVVTFLNASDGTEQDTFFYDVRAEAWLPDEYPAAQGPSALYMLDSDAADDRALLFGTKDGYVLYADNNANFDNVEPIYCNVRYAPLFDDAGADIVLREVSVTLAESSEGCYLRVYAGQTAEQCATSVTPRYQRLLTAGRNTFSVQRVRGKYVQIELVQDDSLATVERFAVESANAVIEISGKSRRLRQQ